MRDDLHRFDYDPHRHADPGCQMPHCSEASAGSLDGTPYCLACVELVLDRAEAVELAPALRNLLPDLTAEYN